MKQAVIAASALSLLYPRRRVSPAIRARHFLDDLVREAQTDIRRCLAAGATVQIDFTEGRLCIKLDPSKKLLDSFVDLNNRVLDGFTAGEAKKIGIHTCPGGDQDSTHSADVDYAELLPALFRIDVGNFFVQLASETDRPRVLKILGVAREERPPGLRRRHGPDLAARRDGRPRSATGSSRRRSSSTRRTSARPTTAASRRSATTRRPRATPPSPRSARASRATRWRRRSWAFRVGPAARVWDPSSLRSSGGRLRARRTRALRRHFE